MHRPRLSLLLLLLAIPACGEDQSPTAPTSIPQAGVGAATALAFLQLSAGSAQTCGVTRDYRAYCWGRGTTGAGRRHTRRYREASGGDWGPLLSTGERGQRLNLRGNSELSSLLLGHQLPGKSR